MFLVQLPIEMKWIQGFPDIIDRVANGTKNSQELTISRTPLFSLIWELFTKHCSGQGTVRGAEALFPGTDTFTEDVSHATKWQARSRVIVPWKLLSVTPVQRGARHQRKWATCESVHGVSVKQQIGFGHWEVRSKYVSSRRSRAHLKASFLLLEKLQTVCDLERSLCVPKTLRT